MRLHGPSRGRGEQRDESRGRRRSRKRLFETGQLAFIVLDVIARTPSHGHDIIKLFEQRFGGVYSPSPGVIYPTLALLEDQGYVSVSSDRTKKLYTITSDGAAYLRENRDFVSALNQRLNTLADRKGRSHYPELRNAMHDLKQTVLARLESGPPSARLAHQMEGIIRRSAKEIKEL